MFQNGALAQLVPPVELGVGETDGEAEGELDCDAVGVDVGQVPPPVPTVSVWVTPEAR
jgi:hypothetical protein